MSVEDLDKHRNSRPRPLAIRSASHFHGKPVPDRNWLVPSILIRGGVTMLSGDGGVGKSLLCLQLQVAAALGEPWLGIQLGPEPMSSFGFYCEDDEDELHRRLYDICCHYNCSLDDLGDTVRFISRVGEQNELMTFYGRDQQGKRTVLLEQLEAEVKTWRTQLVLIDTVADTFMGNENIRPQVRAYVTAIRRLAIINSGGVIFTAHPSRSGLADGSGLSGSTGWNGSVRSRIYLTKPRSPDKDIDGEDEPTSERLLKIMKSNYSLDGEKIRMRWDRGVFIPIGVGAPSHFKRLDHDRKLLEAAAHLIERGSFLSADVQNRSALVGLARTLPKCKDITFKEAVDAQERLIADRQLLIVEMGPRSKRRRLVRPSHLRYPGEDENSGETEQSIPQGGDQGGAS